MTGRENATFEGELVKWLLIDNSAKRADALVECHLGAARAWHFQKPMGPGFLSKRPAGRAGPMGLPLHYRLANRESSRLVTFDSKTSSNIVLCHLEPHGVPGDHASNYFLAWPW